jgi:hypothetical protein
VRDGALTPEVEGVEWRTAAGIAVNNGIATPEAK